MAIFSCNKDDYTEEETKVTDIDSNVYTIFKMGKFRWLRENLRVTRYNNGDFIGTTNPDTLDISNEVSPKYQWVYNSNDSNLLYYGRLYTWYTVADSRKLCPEGWHVPSDAEWNELLDSLGGWAVAGAKLKEPGTSHWDNPNTTFSTTGFDAMPGGIHAKDSGSANVFSQLHLNGFWWTTNENGGDYGKSKTLSNDSSTVETVLHKKYEGLSVRCIKD